MQYTYYGTCEDIDIPTEPIKLQELSKYMTDKFECITKKEESDNDKFTRLILKFKLVEAVEMITHVKDLKFNGDLLNSCYNKKHMYCENDYEFDYTMRCICANDDYMSVIILLQFIIPKNIIFKELCNNIDEECECRCCMRKNKECNTMVHNYNSYCAYCIYNGYMNTARAIYIMFEVDNLYILLPPYYHYTGKELNIFKTTYDMILQCQDIIPLKRRGLPNIDISMFVENIYREKVLFDIIAWYYNISPMSYTRKKMDKTLEKAKQTKKIDSKQIIRLEKFFNSINKE